MVTDAEASIRAADALRRLALNEAAKAYVMSVPQLNAIAKRVAQRYVAGETLTDAMQRVMEVNRLGYSATVDFMGESTRTAEESEAALKEFLKLTKQIADKQLNCSVSLDLSHIGSAVSFKQGLKNARQLAAATKQAGIEMIISMEGADRVDDILNIHKALSSEYSHVGITVQARLHRTRQDLTDLFARTGRIRLVKGAYDAPTAIAYPRDSKELYQAYDYFAEQLLSSNHLCSIATHDQERLEHAQKIIDRRNTPKNQYMFEFLSGLGVEQAATMLRRGHSVQEYVVYGFEWWLYVCNRIAEEPTRLFEAIADAAIT